MRLNIPVQLQKTPEGVQHLEIAPIEVGEGTSLAVLGSLKIPQGVSLVEGFIAAKGGTAAAGYWLSATVKNFPSLVAAATGTLTITDQFSENETVVVGGKTYKFVASPSAENDVDIGSDAATSLTNLKAAINAETGAGTKYGTGTTANANVTCTSVTATTLVVTAVTKGSTGNDIASTETGTNASWGGAKLTGGVDACNMVGTVNAVATNEDDSGWTATLVVNGPSGIVEVKATSDSSDHTTFSGYFRLIPMV